MPHVKTNGIETYYGPRRGSADAARRRAWQRQHLLTNRSTLRPHPTVVLYDQRGAGRSACPVRSIEELADDALALLDALKLDRVHFVGHSTGAAIGQSLALDRPNDASLVLYSTVHRSIRSAGACGKCAGRAPSWAQSLRATDVAGPLSPTWVAANDAD